MTPSTFLYNMKKELAKGFNKEAHALEFGPPLKDDLSPAPELEKDYVGVYDMEDFE
jgi:hypothetical protein